MKFTKAIVVAIFTMSPSLWSLQAGAKGVKLTFDLAELLNEVDLGGEAPEHVLLDGRNDQTGSSYAGWSQQRYSDDIVRGLVKNLGLESFSVKSFQINGYVRGGFAETSVVVGETRYGKALTASPWISYNPPNRGHSLALQGNIGAGHAILSSLEVTGRSDKILQALSKAILAAQSMHKAYCDPEASGRPALVVVLEHLQEKIRALEKHTHGDESVDPREILCDAIWD